MTALHATVTLPPSVYTPLMIIALNLNSVIITITCMHACSRHVDPHTWFQSATLTGYNA